jgi:hypothetical protein
MGFLSICVDLSERQATCGPFLPGFRSMAPNRPPFTVGISRQPARISGSAGPARALKINLSLSTADGIIAMFQLVDVAAASWCLH